MSRDNRADSRVDPPGRTPEVRADRDASHRADPCVVDGVLEEEERADDEHRSADAREPHEDVVERVPPMLDDPALPVTIKPGQAVPMFRLER